MSFPALDLPTFTLRTVMPKGDVQLVESVEPGFIAARIAINTAWIYARLRKRYQYAIPFGQTPPTLIAAGLTPPNVTLQGVPTLGAYRMIVQVTTGGQLGTAIFKWSSDGGRSWTVGVATAATSIALGQTGMSALFSPGGYDPSNVYAAATPIPEEILDWLTVLTTGDAFDKRGTSPQDPVVARLAARELEVRAEVKEAADGQSGLFDLPTSADQDSAIDSGSPFGCSTASPYASADRFSYRARSEDYRWPR
jgi:hypothetical protein